MSEAREPDARGPGRHAPAPVKRFYARASVGEADGGFVLPRRAGGAHARPASRSSRRAARSPRIAGEWAGQGETIDPAAMPLTRLVNSALDGVARAMARNARRKSRATPAPICSAIAPRSPRRWSRGGAAFDPVLRWAARRSARVSRAPGSCTVAQPPAALGGVARRAGGVRRTGRACRAARHDDADRLGAARAGGRPRPPHAEEAGGSPMSTRISRSSNGARTRKRERGARRDGESSRRRRRCWRRSARLWGPAR